MRFVQVWHGGWDHHTDIETNVQKKAAEVDKPISALLTDLKQRGMLKDTLVIWGGEFGRTPMNEERNGSKFLGRDHHPHCFTMWMAGGGLKRGFTYGETDKLGYHVAKDKVHVHDFRPHSPLPGPRHRLTQSFRAATYHVHHVRRSGTESGVKSPDARAVRSNPVVLNGPRVCRSMFVFHGLRRGRHHDAFRELWRRRAFGCSERAIFNNTGWPNAQKMKRRPAVETAPAGTVMFDNQPPPPRTAASPRSP